MLVVGALAAALTLACWACWACWSHWPRRVDRPAGSAADAAFRRHPAGRAKFGADDDRLSPVSGPPVTDWAVARGPDDDPEFLAELDRVIRRGPEAGQEE